MNSIEQLTFNYLSSYFNQDLNESLEHISEEDLKSALIDLNILAIALNEQVAGHEIASRMIFPYTIQDKIQGKKRVITAPKSREELIGDKVIQDFLQNQDKYATPDTSPLADGGLDKEGVPNLLKQVTQKPAASAKDYVTRREFRPNKPDEIEAIYATYSGSGETPYQGPGGGIKVGNIEEPKIDVPKSTAEKIKAFVTKGAEYLTKAHEKVTQDRAEVQKQLDAVTKDFTRVEPDYERITAIKARQAQDAEFEKNLPNLAKLGADYEEAKAAKIRPDLTAGRGTPEGERAITDLLSKPTLSARAEAARQSAIASRQKSARMDVEAGNVTALSDPDRFEHLKSQGAEATGEIKGTGEKAFTLDDRLRYQVKKRTEELTGGRPATRYGSNLYVEQYTGSSSGPTGRVNVINVGAERETGRRMRGPSNTGYPSRFPGAMVGPAGRPASQERLDAMDERIAKAEEIRQAINASEDPAQEARDFMSIPSELNQYYPIEDRFPSSIEDREAARRHQEESRPRRAEEKLKRDARSDEVRLELANRARARRGMGPLSMDQLSGTKASRTFAIYGDLIGQSRREQTQDTVEPTITDGKKSGGGFRIPGSPPTM